MGGEIFLLVPWKGMDDAECARESVSCILADAPVMLKGNSQKIFPPPVLKRALKQRSLVRHLI